MKSTAVIGIGNVLLSDEGVGVHVVRRMSAMPGASRNVEFIDAGSVGMRLLHLIAGRGTVAIVDCARMGESAGVMREFGPDDVESCKALAGLSLHEGDILTVLDVSRRMGEYPGRVLLFGVEPASVEPGMELSRAVAGRMDEYVRRVAAAIALLPTP